MWLSYFISPSTHTLVYDEDYFKFVTILTNRTTQWRFGNISLLSFCIMFSWVEIFHEDKYLFYSKTKLFAMPVEDSSVVSISFNAIKRKDSRQQHHQLEYSNPVNERIRRNPLNDSFQFHLILHEHANNALCKRSKITLNIIEPSWHCMRATQINMSQSLRRRM